MTEPRLMTGAEAAAYCGVSPGTWSAWVASGKAPKPLPGTRRWDRRALDIALDKLSGIDAQPAADDPNIAWKRQQAEEDAAIEKWLREYKAKEQAEDLSLAEWKIQNEARNVKLKRGG